MRFSLLPIAAAVVALALFAPAAGARLIDTQPAATPAGQDLRSPDARDADAATRARTLQDLIRRQDSLGTSSLAGTTSKSEAALAQERYYSSYGPAPVRHTATDDGSPLLTIVLGFGLTALVAGSVAFAVRTRRRTARVRVAA
jgi:hypothetical protein